MGTEKEPQTNGMEGSDKPERPAMKWKDAIFTIFIVTMIFTTILYMINKAVPETETTNQPQELEYSKLIDKIQNDEIVFVTFISSTIKAIDVNGQEYKVAYLRYDGLFDLMIEHQVVFDTPMPDSAATVFWRVIEVLLPPVLFIIVLIFIQTKLLKGMTRNHKFDFVTDQKTTFGDVAGQDEAKEQIQEIVDYLKNPDRYKKLGAKQPKGALLVGPPGTGKTLLAKAVAGEAGVSFVSANGSEFVEMIVGVGALRVRELFRSAREKAPCIIFIDEIDAVGKKRTSSNNNSETENTLNALLSEMDGFSSSTEIVVLAATNRPEDLDPALLRPGRFDRRVIVNLPDIHGREDILRLHAKGKPLADDVDFKQVAVVTAGCSGADLENILNEAAIEAVRQDTEKITQAYILNAIEVVIAGAAKKRQILTDKEKRIVAYHEIGHALVTAKLSNTMPISKITIIPRTMGALGFVLQTPEEEKLLKTKKEIEEEIITFCGGRAAEELIFQDITTGASNDIEKATNLARDYVVRYGMSTELGFVKLSTKGHQYLGGSTALDCSPETAATIDKEISKLIQNSYNRAKDILQTNMDTLHKLAQELYDAETITGDKFMEILKSIEEGDLSE